jgi:hypothetical protein
MDIVNFPGNIANNGLLAPADVVPADDLVLIGKKVNNKRNGTQYQEESMLVQDFLSLVPSSPPELFFAPNMGGFPAIGDPTVQYIDQSTNKIYRWDSVGSVYVQLANEKIPFGNTTGPVNNYLLNLPEVTALTDGLLFEARINITNTGASTLNLNGYGVKPFVNTDLNPLISDDIEVDSIYLISYNLTNNSYQLQGFAKPFTAGPWEAGTGANSARLIGAGGTAAGANSVSEGTGITSAIATNAHAEGAGTQANNIAAHAEGQNTIASGVGSHAEGANTTASGANAHAEGNGTRAVGVNSHVEGEGTLVNGALGRASHAEGINSIASGIASHAENSSAAQGNYSHTEGLNTLTNGVGAHAEGQDTRADGAAAHAQGFNCWANHPYSFVTGAHADSRNTGSMSQASFKFNPDPNTRGDAQAINITLGKSNNLGNVKLNPTGNASLQRIAIATGLTGGVVASIKLHLVAIDTITQDTLSYSRTYLVSRIFPNPPVLITDAGAAIGTLPGFVDNTGVIITSGQTEIEFKFATTSLNLVQWMGRIEQIYTSF